MSAAEVESSSGVTRELIQFPPCTLTPPDLYISLPDTRGFPFPAFALPRFLLCFRNSCFWSGLFWSAFWVKEYLELFNI